MTNVTMVEEGRRVYIEGNTYPIKDALRDIGCKWDAESRRWWIGSTKRAELEQAVSGAKPAEENKDRLRVFARVAYKGRSYYVVGSNGDRVRLVTLDGKVDFWADRSACELVKRYESRRVGSGRYAREEFQTLGSLRRFVARSREESKAIERGEVPAGYCVDNEDGQIKRRSACDMPSN